MGLVIFGAVGDFIAFALAPQTVVTPVGSFTLGTCWLRWLHQWCICMPCLQALDIRSCGFTLVGDLHVHVHGRFDCLLLRPTQSRMCFLLTSGWVKNCINWT